MAKRTDSRKTAGQPINGETLRAAVIWAIDRQFVTHVKLHGNAGWQAIDRVLLTVIWVWSCDSTHGSLCGSALLVGRCSWQCSPGNVSGLPQGTRHLDRVLVATVWEHLHRLLEEQGGEHWRVGCWVALAVDGSRVSVPRTQENESAFGAPNFGKGRTAQYRRKKKGQRVRRKLQPAQPVKPQIWVTLLWHMGLHMPWSWKSGPSYAAERDHFREMLAAQTFPQHTLFCGDAGVTGYELWKAMAEAGHAFLVRVCAKVTLLRKLGYVRERVGLVYCWPTAAVYRG
jgi:hypothetical protein